MIFVLASAAADAASILTALAGFIGGMVAAYKLLKSPKAEEEPEPPPHTAALSLDEYESHINDLRLSLNEAHETVHALRRRLDAAQNAQQSNVSRGAAGSSGTEWLTGEGL